MKVRRLAVIEVLSGVCFSLLITIVLTISGLQRQEPDAPPLAYSSCSFPCIFGITPGVSSRTEALDQLSQLVLVTDPSQNVFGLPVAGAPPETVLPYTLEIQYGEDEKTETLRLIANINGELARLGDVLRLGGTPTRVFRACNGVFPVRMLLAFGQYEQLVVELILRDGLDPSSPVVMVDAARVGTRTLFDARESFGCSIEVRWHGFAPLWRYVQDDWSL